MRRKIDRLIQQTNERLLWNEISKDRLTRPVAQTFVTQFSLFTRHSRQCWANVVGNCPQLRVRQFLVAENLYEEEANEATSHYNLIVKMGVAVGLTKKQIDEAAPTTSSAVAFLAWETLTRTRPWLEGLSAKMILERLNDKKLANVSAVQAERWRRQLGLSARDVDFFNVHAEVDQVHGGKTMEFIEAYAGTPDKQAAVVAAAEASLQAWTIFFDGIAHSALSAPGAAAR
jgi:pyrroloquinoline quinone (PQQ) biosynthesis protein C